MVENQEIETPAANKKLDKDSGKRWIWWSWLPLAGVIASIIDKIIPKKDEEEEKDNKKKEDEDQKR